MTLVGLCEVAYTHKLRMQQHCDLKLNGSRRPKSAQGLNDTREKLPKTTKRPKNFSVEGKTTKIVQMGKKYSQKRDFMSIIHWLGIYLGHFLFLGLPRKSLNNV